MKMLFKTALRFFLLWSEDSGTLML